MLVDVLLDGIPPEFVGEAVARARREKGRRAPIHMVHRWWSRRFSSVYRLILGSFLFRDVGKVEEALDDPKVMRERSSGKVFFEPFAGGGTGLAEAAFAGFSVFGFDVNPVAVVASRSSLFLVTRGLREGFVETAESVLREAQRMARRFWEFDGGLVSYIFVSRGRVPTWLSTSGGKRVLMCPRCHRIFRGGNVSRAVCPHCGEEFEVSNKAVASLPSSSPEIARGWRAFAVELRWKKDDVWYRKYVTVAESSELSRWLEKCAKKSSEVVEGLEEKLGSLSDVKEASRLRRANISRGAELFLPQQLASYVVYSKAVETIVKGEDERLLFVAAASESAKCCSLLAKWYSPLGECVPASGVKALWVPEYTAVTNPLASEGLRPLARGTLASALRAQVKADSYIHRIGGPSNVGGRVSVGDALESPFPEHVDLVVLDPPYGKIKSYASLSLPHYYALKIFGGLVHLDGINSLDDIEKRELSLESSQFLEKWGTIIRKLFAVTNNESRVVLMFNAVSKNLWLKVIEPFGLYGFYPVAIYWVLGEAPSGVTASRLRGMFLIVFKKGKVNGKIHVVYEEPLDVASSIVSLDPEMEARAFASLRDAVGKVYPRSV